VLAAIVLGAGAVRVRLLDVPFERDEGEYAYAGQLLLEGVPPFTLAYNMKLPGTYAAYAGSMAVFGRSIAGARLGLALVTACTVVLVFLLGRKLLGTGGGLAAAAATAFLSLSTSMLGPFGHATHFVALPATAGALALTSAIETGRRRTLLAAGFLLGLAPIMKQPGFVFPAFGIAWLASARLTRRSPGGAARLAKETLTFAAGAAIPLAVVVAALGAAGVLDRFWFWIVVYAREYASLVPLSEGREYLASTGAQIVAEHPLLVAVAAAGLAMLATPRLEIPNRGFLLAFLGFSLLGVCPGLYFRGHYFLLAVPAVSLLVGAAYHGVERLAAGRAWARGVAAAAIAIGCLQPIVARADLYLRDPPDRVSRAIYGGNPFPESVEIARYIRERTSRADRIAVLGSEPQIYFYADRRGATGHIYTYGLMEEQPLAHVMQQQMIQDIEATRPAYVVWVTVPASWLVTAGSDRTLFAWADRFLQANYDVCGEVRIVSTDRTEYRWDEAAARGLDPDARGALVLRRKGFVPPAPTARP
jgi:hypothetical protein